MLVECSWEGLSSCWLTCFAEVSLFISQLSRFSFSELWQRVSGVRGAIVPTCRQTCFLNMTGYPFFESNHLKVLTTTSHRYVAYSLCPFPFTLPERFLLTSNALTAVL